MRYGCVWAAAAVVTVWAGAAAGQSVPFDQLRPDAEKGWAALIRACESLDATFTNLETTEVKKPPVRITGSVAARGRDLAFLEDAPVQFRAPDGPRMDRVFGRNDDYAFIVERAGGAGPYTVKYLGVPDAAFDERAGRGTAASAVPVTVLGATLPTWLGRPGFTVKSADRRADGRVRLACAYVPPGEGTKSHFPAMTVVCNPDRLWAVESFEVKTWYGRVTGVLEYADRPGPAPTPVKLTTTTHSGPADPPSVDTLEFPTWEYTSPKSERFRLSGYGLPEPPGPPRSWLWAWLLGVGAAAAGLAVAVRRWRAGLRRG